MVHPQKWRERGDPIEAESNKLEGEERFLFMEETKAEFLSHVYRNPLTVSSSFSSFSSSSYKSVRPLLPA